MAAKKQRKGATPHKSKKRAVKKKKASTKRKMKARTKPNVRPAPDILDVPSFLPMAGDNPPPPQPVQSSQLPMVNWNSSLDPTPWMPEMRRNAALLASTGPVEPPVPLTASSLATSPPTFGLPELHAKMIEQIEALEPEIADLRKHQRRRGIGDNNPPEPIELAPLSAKELDEIRKAMAVLKRQPTVPTARSSKVKAAIALLTKVASATLAYTGKQADNFMTAFVTKFGEEAGKRIIKYIFIYELLQQLAETANQWWQSLPPL